MWLFYMSVRVGKYLLPDTFCDLSKERRIRVGQEVVIYHSTGRVLSRSSGLVELSLRPVYFNTSCPTGKPLWLRKSKG